MSKYGYILASLIITFFLWLGWQTPQIRETITQYVENGEILTLEARYTPEQIMAKHTRELMGDSNQRTYQDSTLKFYPYLLMEVKYIGPERRTREGVILWSLIDGEMVINTDTWEKTHGFEDAITVNASPKDFKILNTLAKHRGIMTIDQLQRSLQLESQTLTPWIESAKAKHLIIVRGNEVHLHFQNPRILVAPETKMNEWIVTKPYSHASRAPTKYTRKQIEKAAFAAFGTDFTVRNVREVFLPVYRIEMLNPDGSLLTSYWNALNGRRVSRGWTG